MSNTQLPVAIWQGIFTLFGVEVHCSVLNTGERVIDAGDVERLFLGLTSANEPGDVVAFAHWQRGIDIDKAGTRNGR